MGKFCFEERFDAKSFVREKIKYKLLIYCNIQSALFEVLSEWLTTHCSGAKLLFIVQTFIREKNTLIENV